MRLPDGTIIMHGTAPYDPVKAHQYYLRTRKLKGRRNGAGKVTREHPISVTRSPLFTVKTAKGKTVDLTGQQLTEQRAYAAMRVNKIKNRLAELNAKFKQMVAEAEKKQAHSERESKKAPTATEKSKAARESKQYRDKHKQELKTERKTKSSSSSSGSSSSKSKTSSSTTPGTTPVAKVGQRINQVEDSLRAAVAKQRALAGATRKR